MAPTLGHRRGWGKDGWHSGNRSASRYDTRRDDLARRAPHADVARMTRPLRLAGSLTVLLSLWLPWYGVEIPGELRRAFDAQAGELPPGAADFARGLLDALPSVLRANGWQAFEGADVALALLAGAAAVSVVLAVDVRAVLGAAAAIAGLVLVHVLDQPGPNELVSVKAGPWVALAGAAAIGWSALAGGQAGAPDASAPSAAPGLDPWGERSLPSVPPPG
jgi:hypothetical protein